MKKVRFLDEPKEKALKPIEFTHCLDGESGWEKTTLQPNECKEVIYLGKCCVDGDLFCCKGDSVIDIVKGHLNDGVY